jgi:diacylglycerol kinase (ATP)
MKVAIIAKPPKRSRKGRRTERHNPLEKATRLLSSHRISHDVFLTQYHAHALEIVKELSIENYDALVAMGGDGTNYYVLNGLLKFHGDKPLPPIGIIPTGRGNSFAKDLNIGSIDDALTAIFRQNTVPVDVCRFTQQKNDGYFINLMGFGFVTDVAKTAARFGWAGDLSYIIGVIYRTIGLRFHQLELEIDGTPYDGRNCFVEICNSRYTGGDMLMAPEAQIDDGHFDAVILGPLSRLSLLNTFPKIFKGTHVTHPQVRVVRGKRAVIRTIPEKSLLPDGEIFGQTPTTITVLPRRVRYFV